MAGFTSYLTNFTENPPKKQTAKKGLQEVSGQIPQGHHCWEPHGKFAKLKSALDFLKIINLYYFEKDILRCL